ncbi:MAG: LCP family protein [Bacillota bacterium]
MKQLFYKVLALVVMVSIIVSLGIFLFLNQTNYPQSKSPETPKQNLLSQDSINFLLLGTDAVEEETTRSDVIIVASFAPESKKLSLLSLPRDTKVEIPGESKTHKLNAAYTYGGVPLVLQTVEELLDVGINYYISTDFTGFQQIINILGGVEVDVAKDLKYVDRAGDLYIDIPAGRQTLSGREALDYIRFRQGALGDIGRIERQQKFMQALLEKVTSPQLLFKAPEILKHIKDNVQTNLPWSTTFKLAANLPAMIDQLGTDQVAMETLPGEFEESEGISYWQPHQEQIEIVVDQLLRSKNYHTYQQTKVILLNGSGKVGLASRVQEELSYYGYDIVQVGNAEHFNHRQTKVFFTAASSDSAKELATVVDGQLKPLTETENVKIDQSAVGIKVILGTDYTLK